MSFRDNLLHLRASHNMTQEQLAMLLGVSRQSVTKWESERSYPEMDKLLKLCQTFGCTLDELVQGDLTDRAPEPSAAPATSAPPADVFGYDEFMRRFANRIANGVMTIVLGVAAMLVVFGTAEPGMASFAVLPENIAAALGMLCLLVALVVGLALIIPACMSHAQFVREHPFIEDFYTTEQKARARSAFSYECIGGIAVILVGVCALMALGDTPYEESVGTPALLVCVAVGARFIVHGGLTLGRTNLAEYNRCAGEILDAHEIEGADIPAERKAELLQQSKTDKRIAAVCGVIMLLATIVALLLLFVSYAMGVEDYSQGPITLFWLPWPIGGLLCGIAAVIIKEFGRPEA